MIPKSAATLPEVLHHYGYRSAACGKWHNTPANQTTSMGPFDRWPTGHGFDAFYGFIAGETSQYEPRLYRNTTPIEPPQGQPYHLTEDMAQQAVGWLQQHQAYAPDKPFFMYWTPGAVHGPHHVFAEWADKYKGKFDGGWDAYRERVFARQKELGWIPADTRLNPRPAGLPAWDSLSPEEKKYQARLMEVYAGFLEHADTQAGKVVDELERLGLRDNTLIFDVFSDNGASAEGQQGSIDELPAQNGIPSQPAEHMKVLNEQFGGLAALGTKQLDSMYHAAWAQAGSAPFQGTKLMAGYFGGTRVPLAISWPKSIKPDAAVRGQFHHVNDVAPTIYQVLGIVPPKVVDGVRQDPIDGVSMAYTFADAKAAPQKHTQYFEFGGSRGIYHDGWMASVASPRLPWAQGFAGFVGWDPAKDTWALYKLDHDYAQAEDLAEREPAKLAAMKDLFEREAKENKVYPVVGARPALASLEVTAVDGGDQVQPVRQRTRQALDLIHQLGVRSGQHQVVAAPHRVDDGCGDLLGRAAVFFVVRAQPCHLRVGDRGAALALRDRGVDHARADRADTHAAAGQLERQHFAQAHHGKLGGCIGAHVRWR